MSTHFLPRLMLPTETEESVLSWGNSPLLPLHELHHILIPVNSNNTHWYFIHVDVTKQEITLHNSLPVQPAARQQIEAVRWYLETRQASSSSQSQHA